MGVVTKNTIGKDRSFRKFDVKVSKRPITKKSLGKIILVVYLFFINLQLLLIRRAKPLHNF